MKNRGTILLSSGVLLVGFSLLTPLLFFLIEGLLGKGFETSVLLEMEYAFLSFLGLVLLVLGSIFSAKFSPSIIISSGMASLAMVGAQFASDPKGVFDWVITGLYYCSLLGSFAAGMVILHRSGIKQE